MKDINRNFAKLKEDGVLEYAPIPLPINGNTWTNSEEIHLECGYYPVIDTYRPSKEGAYYTSYYVLEENKIVQKWEEHEVEEIKIEDDAAILAE